MSFEDQLAAYYDKDDDNLNDDLNHRLSSKERYSDFQKISSGGMKTVIKVFDERSQRYVAYARLKESTPDVFNEIFISEARLTAKLNHPNIIPIYDVGIDDHERPFFTMELKIGDSLNDVIKKLADNDPGYLSKYTLINRLNIFVKICDAVAYAHSQKVIHLDLKPENVQIGNYGEVMVCDWGLSKVYEKQFDTSDLNQLLLNPDLLNNMTVYGEIKGSPGFMAPEQILPDKTKDVQTDIFSLGCLLYSLLSFKAPFTGDLETILKITVSGEYPDLSTSVPKSLTAVTIKAMQVDKLDRYKSVSDLKKDVENYLHGYATEAENAGPILLFKFLVLRNKLLSTVIIVTVFGLIAGTGFFVAQINAEKNIAQEEKFRAEENLELFKEQKAATEKEFQEKFQAFLKVNNRTFHNNFYESPARAYKRTLEGLLQLSKDFPDSKGVISSIGNHYFIGQNFSEAKKYLSKFPEENKELIRIIDVYHPLKEEEFLEFTDFRNLFKSVQIEKTIYTKMFLMYAYKNNDPQQLLELVKIFLEKLNPDWQEKEFNYDLQSRSLTLGGKNLSVFSTWRTPLYALKVDHLFLKSASITDLKAFENLGIRTLDISQTSVSIKKFRQYQFFKLNKLIINQHQHRESKVVDFDEDIEIVVKN